MSRYIDVDALLLKIDCHGTNKFGMLDEDIRDFVRKIPAADVVKVKHGEWFKHYKGVTTVSVGFVCSCCDVWNERKTSYCPNCGAKMDEKER